MLGALTRAARPHGSQRDPVAWVERGMLGGGAEQGMLGVG